MVNSLQAINLKTTLVLLPGLDGTEIFFGPLLRHLPSWIESLVITYPATGNNDYEDLLPIAMNAVSALESFVILGSSFGGPLALMIASRCPSQVSGVILCGSFVTPPRPGLVPFRFAISAPLIALIRAIRRLRLIMPGYATTDFRRAKAITWRRVNASVLASRARSVLGVDVRPQLRECPARLMYLASTRDEVISRDSLNEILSIAPHTKVAEIEGPHFSLFTNPVQSAACIVNFLHTEHRLGSSVGKACRHPFKVKGRPLPNLCNNNVTILYYYASR